MQSRFLTIGWAVISTLMAAAGQAAENPGAPGIEAERLDNWHQWRGPMANGVAPRGDPPIRWDASTNIRWKVSLPGLGSSSPIVWNDHVFLLAAIETDREASPSQREAILSANQGQLTEPPASYHRYQVIALDRSSGAIRWQRTAREAPPHEGRHATNTFASASPITDGRRIFVSFGSRGIYCFDFEGNAIWQRDLGDMRTRRGWGEGASPALFENTLLVNWDHEGESFLAALDTATGQLRWQVQRDEPTSWSTPLVVSHTDPPQVVVSATNRVRSYDLHSGELLWECGGLTTNVIASPVAAGDTVYCMSWYGKSAVFALPVDGRGDLTQSDRIRWAYHDVAPYCPSPLLYEGQLYFTGANRTILTSLDAATGETVIPPRRLPELQGDMYASPVAAGGRIYFVARDGTTLVAGHGPELEVLAVNRLDDPIDASPAIVGRQMFLRGRGHLYCLESRQE